jgi:hypothetical protein
MARLEFEAVLEGDDGTTATGISLPFDPKAAFGKARAPVRGTIGGAPYRTTVAIYGGRAMIPVRRELREAAGAKAGDTVHVVMELDAEERTVDVPDDLAAAIAADQVLSDVFDGMSFTNRKEFVRSVAEAMQPETRVRRIERVVASLRNEASKRRP